MFVDYKKLPRCRGCNNRIDPEFNKGLDPEEVLCDKCYIKIEDPQEFTIILELDIDREKCSAEELIKHFENIGAPIPMMLMVIVSNLNYKRKIKCQIRKRV